VVNFPSDNTRDDDADIISVARWHHYPIDYEYAQEAAWEIATFPEDMVSGTEWPMAFNVKVHDFMLTQRDSFREQWIAKSQPAWILMHLVTRPSWRGRGAAAMLIEWYVVVSWASFTTYQQLTGVKSVLQKDKRWRTWNLEQPQDPLYERRSFKQAGEIRHLKLEPFGLNVVVQLANMSWCAPAESIEEKSTKE